MSRVRFIELPVGFYAHFIIVMAAVSIDNLNAMKFSILSLVLMIYVYEHVWWRWSRNFFIEIFLRSLHRKSGRCSEASKFRDSNFMLKFCFSLNFIPAKTLKSLLLPFILLISCSFDAMTSNFQDKN